MKACYAGSFDPFTNGHLDILTKAVQLFDRIDIVIANNPKKQRRFDMSDTLKGIIQIVNPATSSSLFHSKTINVTSYDGLIPTYCSDHRITHLIRGLRGTSDWLYEEELAKAYNIICPEIQIVYLRGTHEGLSSTLVWELYSRGRDVSKYVPYEL